MSSNIYAVDDDSFENDVMKTSIPVVVDFWAQWCAPCKALTPIVEDVAEHYGDKIKFVKMDVDRNPNIPPKFGVRGIPTLILFVGGQVKATHVGLIGKMDLIKFLDQNI